MNWIRVLLCCLFYSSLHADQLDLAWQHYEKGMQADELTLRSKEINLSLNIYLYIAETRPGGELFYNIGNCFFALQDLPRAAFYYEKALYYFPRNQELIDNLNLVRRSSGLKERELSWWPKLSESELVLASIAATCLATLYFSLSIWLPHLRWGVMGKSIQALVLLLVLACFCRYFFSGKGGVAVEGEPLRSGAGLQYATIGSVRSCEVVSILDQSSAGQWIKVETEGRQVGFLPQAAIRVMYRPRS
jgi:hypothetical protein